MQPFEKHPADAGALQAYGEDLVTQGSQALQLGTSTRAAYQPAVPAVQGVPAPAVAAAPIPVDQAADVTSGALVWGAVATQYWGKQVGDFNTEVDGIVAELQAAEAQARTAAAAAASAPGPNGAPAGPTAPGADAQPALDAAMLAAREKWFEAYRVHIEAGQAQASAMLAQGPTAQNAAVARDSGVMPGVQFDMLNQFLLKSGARAALVHPDGQGLLGTSVFGIERGLNGMSYADKYWRYRHTTFQPIAPNGRTVNRAQWTADTTFRDRFAAYQDSRNWRARRGQSANFKDWKGISRITKPLGPAAAGVAGVVDQWTRDAGRTDIGTGERVARAGVRGGLNAAGSFAGAAAGAKIGALGGAFFGPVGFAVGGIGGAIVGGIAGSALASEGADAILDNG